MTETPSNPAPSAPSPPLARAARRPMSLSSLATGLLASSLLLVVAVVGYHLAVSQIEADLYRERLQTLAGEYESLRTHYNDAIRQAAVTELVVDGESLSVVRRDLHGREEVIETNLDVSETVHVDFVIYGDRLWIRSIHDGATPPNNAENIDPEVFGLDWDDPALQYGISVFRRIDEGRWIVTATQGGALALRKREPGEDVVLVAAPPVRAFEEIDESVSDDLDKVSVRDAVGHLLE